MDTEQTAPPRNYLKSGFILVALDAAIYYGTLRYLYLSGSGSIFLNRFVFHVVLGVWIGFILNWLHKSGKLKNRKPVILYWAAFGGSFLTGGHLNIVAWMTAVFTIMTASDPEFGPDRQEGPESGDDTIEKTAKTSRLAQTKTSVWPVYAALIVLAGLITYIFYSTTVDPREWGGLSLFVLQIFITPIFLIIPGLLKIPAAATAKTIISNIQVVIYIFLAISWLVSFVKLSQ